MGCHPPGSDASSALVNGKNQHERSKGDIPGPTGPAGAAGAVGPKGDSGGCGSTGSSAAVLGLLGVALALRRRRAAAR